MELFEKDYISIKSKREAVEYVCDCYGEFGWTLKEKKDDRRYYDTVHLTFERPHGIPNKDELQLLQVRLELAFNKSGKLAAKKKQGALICGNFYLFSALIFIACALCLILLAGGLAAILVGAFLCALALAVSALGAFIAINVYKDDDKKYEILMEEQYEIISQLCAKAKILRGDANE